MMQAMQYLNFKFFSGGYCGHRLFKPVGIKKDEKDKRAFLKLSFANKG
jgi:hypothetical protein